MGQVFELVEYQWQLFLQTQQKGAEQNPPAIQPLSGPNSFLYNAKYIAEPLPVTYEHQFTENPGPTIPDVFNFPISSPK